MRVIVSDLEDIEAYIVDRNLDSGYILKLFRWNDADRESKRDKFLVIRQDGGGLVDRDMGRPFFQILLIGGDNEDPNNGYSRAELIRDTMIEDYKTGCIIQFQFTSDIIGPLFASNNRPIYEINFTALTSRG